MIKRFMKKVSPEPNSGCWLWTGAYHRQGYGQFYVAPTIVLAHRASWLLHRGWMPEPEVRVCHKCDVTSCVNPDHLWLGSQQDNVRDAFAKGRMPRPQRYGEDNAASKLTRAQVEEIRSSKVIARVLADKFGVSRSAIWMARRGSNWL